MAQGLVRRKGSADDHNEAVRGYIEEVVHGAYSDVLQRPPTPEEVTQGCDPALLKLGGVVKLHYQLLCSAEFLNRFTFVMSPLLVARMLINQISGHAPRSAMDIENLAAKLVSSGWCPFIQTLMEDSRVEARIMSDMREIAARKGVSNVETDGRGVSPDRARSRPRSASAAHT